MTSPFARFTNAKTGRPAFVDVFEIVAIDTDKDDPSETIVVFSVGADQGEIYVVEDPDSAMDIIVATLTACSEVTE